MKAAIISLGSKSSKWTAEAMKRYFEKVDDLNLKLIEVNIEKESEILYDGKPIEKYDCVYVKGSFRYAAVLRTIADVLEKKGIYTPIRSSTFTSGHDKLLTHLELTRNKIPMPNAYLASAPTGAKEILRKINYPIIMKLPGGTQGKGVMFSESHEAASSMLDTLEALNQPFIIQEYVETGGKDIRAFVIGDKVVAAMQRSAKSNEKRSNIHTGGTGQPIELSSQNKRIAIETAKAIGAEICGVDILESEVKGSLVIEVNLSPGLQGIMKSTDIDVADKIAKYLYQRTSELVTHGKEDGASEILKDLGIDVTAKKSRTCDDSIAQSCDASNTIITNLDERGERLLLPAVVSRLSGITEKKEVSICIKKGKVIIEENP